jgi:hypothetical protein
MKVDVHTFEPVHGESVAVACAALELCAKWFAVHGFEDRAKEYRDALIDIVTASKSPGLLNQLERAKKEGNWPEVKTQ